MLWIKYTLKNSKSYFRVKNKGYHLKNQKIYISCVVLLLLLVPIHTTHDTNKRFDYIDDPFKRIFSIILLSLRLSFHSDVIQMK